MKKQTSCFYLCLVALAWLGLHIGNATSSPAVSAAPAPVAAAEGCSTGIGNIRIQRGAGGNNFVVSWDAPSPCLNGFEVSLTVIKLSGAERTDKKKINSRILTAAFSFAGDGDLNPIKKARATVTGRGLMAAKGTLTKNLGFSSGTGSSASQALTTPTPVPTFALQGRVVNSQTGQPLTGVTLTFELVGLPRRSAISVETNGQGRWQQDGFPIGRQVRITTFKRFFVIEPASHIAEKAGVLEFKGRPSDSAAAPPPAKTFAANGQVNVFSSSQGATTPLSGATISFTLQNPSAGPANVPGPVTTQSDGRWSQSGFTAGFEYFATSTKTGVLFADVKKINGPAQGVNFLGRTK